VLGTTGTGAERGILRPMKIFLDQLPWALLSIASIAAIVVIGIVLTRMDDRMQSKAHEAAQQVPPDANDAKGE
jgi:hypothetical protein